jgi:hypothetical protein
MTLKAGPIVIETSPKAMRGRKISIDHRSLAVSPRSLAVSPRSISVSRALMSIRAKVIPFSARMFEIFVKLAAITRSFREIEECFTWIAPAPTNTEPRRWRSERFLPA